MSEHTEASTTTTSSSSAAPSQSTTATSKYSLTEVYGNLFDSQDSLCHCVSEDLHMGKGIAVTFKEKFGRVSELLSQKASPGGMCFLYLASEKRFAYYLVTKQRYFHKPTYATLESSLTLMRDHAVANKVTAISMPLLGCGLDRLEWSKVKEMINKLFGETNIQITVYQLPPGDTTPTNTSGSRGRGRGSRGGQRGRGRGGKTRGTRGTSTSG